MIKEEQKFTNSSILEGMTSISALLNSQADNDRRIEKILIDREKRKNKAAEIGFLTAKSHELGFEIEFTDSETISSLSIGNTHGGILALCTERTIPSLNAASILKNSFYVYLDGIEDPYNFGYTLRSLYAAGVAGVVLPPRNWMSAAGVVARASAGASELLPIYVCEGEAAVQLFKEADYSVLCAGIRDSVSIYEEHFPLPVLLVVGGEKRGISRTLLDSADKIVRIDYGREFRGSLSAASAATVMAFEILRQNKFNK
ncbi:MAG: RNA methyltransferase [Ruminococcaceae bacterium]|nr:RNA methyltransferase [Oscillospiraceae bacterium]